MKPGSTTELKRAWLAYGPRLSSAARPRPIASLAHQQCDSSRPPPIRKARGPDGAVAVLSGRGDAGLPGEQVGRHLETTTRNRWRQWPDSSTSRTIACGLGRTRAGTGRCCHGIRYRRDFTWRRCIAARRDRLRRIRQEQLQDRPYSYAKQDSGDERPARQNIGGIGALFAALALIPHRTATLLSQSRTLERNVRPDSEPDHGLAR